jgi:hypothetical protein
MPNQTTIILTADRREDVSLTIDSLLAFLPSEAFRLDSTPVRQLPDGKWAAFGVLHIDVEGALKAMGTDKVITPDEETAEPA